MLVVKNTVCDNYETFPAHHSWVETTTFFAVTREGVVKLGSYSGTGRSNEVGLSDFVEEGNCPYHEAKNFWSLNDQELELVEPFRAQIWS